MHFPFGCFLMFSHCHVSFPGSILLYSHPIAQQNMQNSKASTLSQANTHPTSPDTISNGIPVVDHPQAQQ